MILGAVGHGAGMLIPALDGAGEAVALAHAADVDLFASLKLRNGQLVAHFQLGHVIQAELAQVTGGGHAGLLEMARERAC